MRKKKTLFLCLLLLTMMVLAVPAHAKKRKVVMTPDSVKTAEATYNPYYGKKLKIISTFMLKNVKNDDRYSVTVSIKNDQGKTVFKKSKTFKGKKIRSAKGVLQYSFKWKGKASKGNSAKIKKDYVVPSGQYQVVAVLKCKRAKGAVKPKKVFTSAPLTIDGTTISYTPVKTKVVQMYTGTAEIDYSAERMLQEAGVKLDMPEELRVRLIYNYMTVHFRHLQETGNIKPIYNLKALASEVSAYKALTKKRVKAGEVTLTNKWSGELNHFLKQAGTCNNNAAAFAILCNHVGIKCKRIWGKVYNGSATMNHYWNSAVVDGVRWYYDIDVEIHHYSGNGVSSFKQYMKTLEQSKKSHVYM